MHVVDQMHENLRFWISVHQNSSSTTWDHFSTFIHRTYQTKDQKTHGASATGSLSSLCSLLHIFHREIEMRVGDFVRPPFCYGDRLPVRRDLFRQPSASSGMVGRLSTLGLIFPQDVVAGFWLWWATFFSGGFGRLGSEFISDFVLIVLRFCSSILSAFNPLVIERMQSDLFFKWRSVSYRQCLWLLDLAALFSIELLSAYGLSEILESPLKFFSVDDASIPSCRPRWF